MISVNVQFNGPLNATLLLLLCPFVGRAFARTQHNLLMLVAMAATSNWKCWSFQLESVDTKDKTYTQTATIAIILVLGDPNILLFAIE